MDANENLEISHEYLVEAIRSSTNEVFSTMLSLEITAGDTQLEKAVAAAPASGLVSLIGLAGKWTGTGSIACTGALACKLASQLLMAPYESVNEDVLDAVGEITNMIIGNVKTALEMKVGDMGLSTPTVIFGRNFQTRSARIHSWTVVPFMCEAEKLFVQVCVAPNREAERTGLRPGFQMPQVLTI